MAQRFDDIKRSNDGQGPRKRPTRIPKAPSAPSAALPQEVKPAPSTLPSSDYFSALASHSAHKAKRMNGVRKKETSRKTAESETPPYAESDEARRERLDIPFVEPRAPRRSHRSLWIAGGVVVVVLLVFFGMNYFASADITITPRQETAAVSGTFTASRGGSESAAGPAFEVMTVPESVSTDIPADQDRKVDERAGGTIIIYNNYSSASQRLIKNTRFETPDGKIYRAKDSIVVPGTTIEGGKTVPGSAEALVVADEPGEKYNIGLTDFTIPGFKGDPRYQKFYARSKTEMSGGFSGVKKFPSQSAIDAAAASLYTMIADKLAQSAQAQKPSGYILFPAATKSTIAEEPEITVDGGTATVMVSGAITGVIFNRDELARFLLQKSLASFDGAPVDVPDLDTLTFTFAPADQSLEKTPITFTLAGSMHAIWRVDTDGLVRALAGKAKKDFNTTLSDFANIHRAEATISPFWLFDFPSDPARIKTTLVTS